ncbi:MAG: M3 family oligoendopeptidase [Candidatus Promineifilaceae bacterium]
MARSSYNQEAWSLDDLFPGFDTPEIQRAQDQLEQEIQQFESLRSKLDLAMPEADFVAMLQAYERLVRLSSRLMAYGILRFRSDTQDQRAQTAQAQFRQMAAEAENRTLFFKLWWKELDDQPAERLMSASDDYRYWLETLRIERPYTLTEPEEKVINLKDVNGTLALLTLYRTITDRYIFELEVEGEIEQLNREELSVYFRHPEPGVRAAAYQELHRVFAKDAPVLGQIYQHRVRDWYSENMMLRHFASPIAVRNLYNDIPDQVVDTLLEVCRANAPLFQRYFRMKARWVGMEKLRRVDLYAPVVKTERRYTFAEAADLVLDSYQRFDPRVAVMAERVLAEHHLDGEVRKGKYEGAFCMTVTPDLTPWILQSYNGRPDDVATLAHELGHAVHSMAAAHHTALTQQAGLPLAETASTFGEMLVVDRLLAGNPDAETRRDLLFQQMDRNYATIMRQAYFALFEREAHKQIQAGARIDDLSELYFENLAEQFGDSLELNDTFRLEWIAIPHIYSVPFYVYAYAFGQLLVLSLYQQYLEEGEAFRPRYLEILAAGGSDSAAGILDRAGIDIYDAGFWQSGFDVVEEALNELEQLELPAPRANEPTA